MIKITFNNLEELINCFNKPYTYDFIYDFVDELIYIVNDISYVWNVNTHTVNAFLDGRNFTCFSIGDFKYNNATIMDFKKFVRDLE